MVLASWVSKPPLAGGPFQHSPVVSSFQPCILDTADVQIWQSAQGAIDYVHVEVLVCRETQHRFNLTRLASGNQACANSGLWKALLVLFSDSYAVSFALTQVGVNFASVV
jgi:hypothetical protein